MPFLKKLLDYIVNISAVLAGAAIIVMMTHISIDVVLRALFNRPLTGTITFVSNYYMVVVVCLPLAFVERMGGHISVEVLTERFPNRVAHHLYNLILLPSALVCALVTWSTWSEAISKFAMRTFVMEQSMHIPIWFGYFALPFGYGLLTLYLLLKFLLYITNTASPSPATAENDSGLQGAQHD